MMKNNCFMFISFLLMFVSFVGCSYDNKFTKSIHNEITQEQKDEIYNFYISTLNSKDNPAFWNDDQKCIKDVIKNSSEWNENINNWKSKVTAFENNAMQETAKNYNIKVDDVEDIYYSKTFENNDVNKLNNFTVSNGEIVLKTIDSENKLTLKVLVNDSITDDDNLNNIKNLITNQGADYFDKIQYITVLDDNDIENTVKDTFYLNKEYIDKIKSNNLNNSELIKDIKVIK